MRRESRKRSSCGSGSGKVPVAWVSFCVAITMNGRGSWRVMPSMVTRPSFMLSSKADCTRGEVRLISSASRQLENTGPGMNSKPPVAER